MTAGRLGATVDVLLTSPPLAVPADLGAGPVLPRLAVVLLGVAVVAAGSALHLGGRTPVRPTTPAPA